MGARTLFDKVWEPHVVADLGGGHDAAAHRPAPDARSRCGRSRSSNCSARGLRPRNPELTFATPDHAVSTSRAATPTPTRRAAGCCAACVGTRPRTASGCSTSATGGQGIVHVVGPEPGLTLPGLDVVCGDSHTCTHGGARRAGFRHRLDRGAHVLATQTLVRRSAARDARHASTARRAAASRAKDIVLAHDRAASALRAAPATRSSTRARAIRALAMEGAA